MSEQRISDERLACLLRHFESPHGLKMQSDTDTAAALRELAALRKAHREIICRQCGRREQPERCPMPISDERIQEARTRAQQRAGDFHMAWLQNPRFVEADSDVHALLAAVAERDQELAALRRPVVQGEPVEAIRKRRRSTDSCPYDWHDEDIDILVSAVDAAQREIQSLKTDLAVDRQLLADSRNSEEDYTRRIAELERVPEERKEIAASVEDARTHPGLLIRLAIEMEQVGRQGSITVRLAAQCIEELILAADLLTKDNTRLRNAHADRVRMLGFTQDELTARNKECVELRADLEHKGKWGQQYVDLWTAAEKRIERLEGALHIAIADIESWHEALDETVGLPPEANVLPQLRAALAAADGQKQRHSHVCGLEGYNGMIDSLCPGCKKQSGTGDGAAGE